METPGAPAASTEGGSNTLIYVLAFLIIVAVAGIGYYAFGSKTNVIPAKKDPNNPANKPIPGVNPGAAAAAGVLTDKSFFDGLANLANTFYGIAKDAKAPKQTGEPAFTGGNQNPDSGQGQWVDQGGAMVWVPNNA